jgi:hypothetical protein
MIPVTVTIFASSRGNKHRVSQRDKGIRSRFDVFLNVQLEDVLPGDIDDNLGHRRNLKPTSTAWRRMFHPGSF